MKLHVTHSLLATRYVLSSNKGQSLTEILIAVSIGALIVGSAVAALLFTVKSNQLNRANEGASPLAQELLDNVKSVAEGRWQTIYCLDSGACLPAKGPGAHYFLDASLNLVAGNETKVVNDITYTRYFTVENVDRDKCGTGEITSTGQVACVQVGTLITGVWDDPSTQKITSKVTWSQGGDTPEVSVVEYLTRSKNEINQFIDWSGSACDTDSNGYKDVACGGDNATTANVVTQPSKDYSSQSGLDTTSIPGKLQLAP